MPHFHLSRALTLTGCAAALAIAAAVPAAAATPPATPAATVTDTAATCPAHPQPLPPNAVAGASTAALAAAARLYPGIDTTGAYVTSAARGPNAGARGDQIADECGTTVQQRSVVVDLEFPAMLPSASLSEGTVFVDRTAGRYQVWQVAH